MNSIIVYYFIPDANLSITELFPSEELQKVLEAQSFSPEVVEILMKSVISMVADPSKVNLSKLCNLFQILILVKMSIILNRNSFCRICM